MADATPIENGLDYNLFLSWSSMTATILETYNIEKLKILHLEALL